MTALAAAAHPGSRAFGGGVPTARLAWRNLWRNRRRTWLTAGGIGFAVWMLIIAMSMQDGAFGIMVDNAARLFTGHVQVQHPAFQDDPALEHRLSDVTPLLARAAATPHVTAVLPRTEAFALASGGDRSFGALVQGVDPSRERGASTLPGLVDAGRYLDGPGQAFVGAALARNLGIVPGDELVVLGNALEGGVAAAVAQVVGTFATGQAELDRSVLQIHIDDFRTAWNLEPAAIHRLVLLLDGSAAGPSVMAALEQPGHTLLDWQTLMPDAQQTVELKRIGAQLFFVLVALIVTFSVVNTFMMTVFERTPEFGMLMALGMRHGAIARQLSTEALWLSVLGVALGLSVSAVLVGVLAMTGVPVPADAAEMLARYNMPDRMYPAFSTGAAVVAAVVMLVGTQVAVLVPVLKVRRLNPVQALRALE